MTILRKIWRFVRWPLLVLVVAYAVLVAFRIPAVGEKQRTADTIAAIQAQKITLSDVMGTALPPQPYEPENDATVAGLDKNNNGIRDDVELAIFAKYPHSAKIRAAELQYALDQQMMMTQVFNSETWIAAAQEDSRGYACISDSVPNSGDLNADMKIVVSRINEVKALVFDIKMRQDAKDKAYNFTTSYGDLKNVSDCDIDLNTLPN
jgi:hypothetical protein